MIGNDHRTPGIGFDTSSPAMISDATVDRDHDFCLVFDDGLQAGLAQAIAIDASMWNESDGLMSTGPDKLGQ